MTGITFPWTPRPERVEPEVEAFPPPFVVVHNSGPGACGYPAYYLMKRPLRGTPAQSADARHLDGSKVLYCEPHVCDTCRRPLLDFWTADIFPVVQS